MPTLKIANLSPRRVQVSKLDDLKRSGLEFGDIKINACLQVRVCF